MKNKIGKIRKEVKDGERKH